MAYRAPRYPSGSDFSGFWYTPPAVKWLLKANLAIWVVYFLASNLPFLSFLEPIFEPFKLKAGWVILGAVWQFVTYLFLHNPFGLGHILYNMLALWMFGRQLEQDWGTRKFVNYYVLCGVGAGICDVAANVFMGSLQTATIGASGAIFGLILAFGYVYRDQPVMFSFLFPIPAKYFAMIYGAIAFFGLFSGPSLVSHVAHLGGMLAGFILLKYRPRGPEHRLGRELHQLEASPRAEEVRGLSAQARSQAGPLGELGGRITAPRRDQNPSACGNQRHRTSGPSSHRRP